MWQLNERSCWLSWGPRRRSVALAGRPDSPGCFAEDQREKTRKCVPASADKTDLWCRFMFVKSNMCGLPLPLRCHDVKKKEKKKTAQDDIHQSVQRLSSQRLCYLYDFLSPLSLKPCWNRKWRRLPTLSLLITDELGPGYEMHYEAELRGITGVWTVNLYICRGPPPEKARLLRLDAHLCCLPARQPGTAKS